MSELGSRECSWWDEERGIEVINSEALYEYFCDHMELGDWRSLNTRDFPHFVQFIQASYPQWAGLELWLWSGWQIGG